MCENRCERWSSLIFWFVAVVKMPHILWLNGRTMSADFICFSTRSSDAVRISLLFEISKRSSSLLWIRMARFARWNVYYAQKIFFVLLFLLFFSFSFRFTSVAVVVYLLETQAGTDWRLGCVLLKINGSHIFLCTSFLKMPILQPATRAHTLAAFFGCLDAIFACLWLISTCYELRSQS